MNKTCESLNVAIATSIILYEMNKRWKDEIN
jgi:tRNA G18 (ribose-2'-O)-methylase SpoU